MALPAALVLYWSGAYVFRPQDPHPPLMFSVGYVAVFSGTLWFRWWSGFVLTPTHAELRGITVQRIPWSSISGVGQVHSFGTDWIVLWTTDGTAVKTPAPHCRFGLRAAVFERDFHTIGQWWLAVRAEGTVRRA